MITVLITLLTPSYLNANGETVSYVVNNETIIAACALGIVGLIAAFKSDYWKHVFLIIILISWTGLIQFVPFGFRISIGFVALDFIALALLFLHLMFNPELFDEIKSFIPKGSNTPKDGQVIELSEERVSHFEKNFKAKSESELVRIVEENDRVPEAVEAAKRLLKNNNVL